MKSKLLAILLLCLLQGCSSSNPGSVSSNTNSEEPYKYRGWLETYKEENKFTTFVNLDSYGITGRTVKFWLDMKPQKPVKSENKTISNLLQAYSVDCSAKDASDSYRYVAVNEKGADIEAETTNSQNLGPARPYSIVHLAGDFMCRYAFANDKDQAIKDWQAFYKTNPVKSFMNP